MTSNGEGNKNEKPPSTCCCSLQRCMAAPVDTYADFARCSEHPLLYRSTLYVLQVSFFSFHFFTYMYIHRDIPVSNRTPREHRIHTCQLTWQYVFARCGWGGWAAGEDWPTGRGHRTSRPWHCPPCCSCHSVLTLVTHCRHCRHRLHLRRVGERIWAGMWGGMTEEAEGGRSHGGGGSVVHSRSE